MSLSLEGVTIPTTADGSSSGGDDDGSSIFSDILGALPGTLGGSASLINALNGKTPVTYAAAPVTALPAANSGFTYIAIGIVVIMLLFFFIKK